MICAVSEMQLPILLLSDTISPVAQSPSPPPVQQDKVTEVAHQILDSLDRTVPDQSPGKNLLESEIVRVLANVREPNSEKPSPANERQPIRKEDGASVHQGDSRKSCAEAAVASLHAAPEAEKKEMDAASSELDRVVDEQEKALVKERVALLSEKLGQWRTDYDPAPAFVLSWVPAAVSYTHLRRRRCQLTPKSTRSCA